MFILRAILILLSSISSYYIAYSLTGSIPIGIIGVGVGVTLSLILITLESTIKNAPTKSILGGLVGLILAIFIANLLSSLFFENQGIDILAKFIMVIFLSYLGISIGINKGLELDISNIRYSMKYPRKDNTNYKILDTSVIIDGRIADICKTGFIEGTIIIPQFVLHELQHIADSPDPVKRTRGRRGLEILQKIQKELDLSVKIVDQDFSRLKGVDAKLVALAKSINGKVITNDFNLNKVAELQGVSVLNVNELANSLKPVLLPGEVINVKILKEGKEYGQGVAYLDDGTMVVVDNAKDFVGKNIDVEVTSVLQTTSGKMIFTKIKDEVLDNYYPSLNAGGI
jgi:uncharacterized protein YacL